MSNSPASSFINKDMKIWNILYDFYTLLSFCRIRFLCLFSNLLIDQVLFRFTESSFYTLPQVRSGSVFLKHLMHDRNLKNIQKFINVDYSIGNIKLLYDFKWFKIIPIFIQWKILYYFLAYDGGLLHVNCGGERGRSFNFWLSVGVQNR